MVVLRRNPEDLAKVSKSYLKSLQNGRFSVFISNLSSLSERGKGTLKINFSAQFVRFSSFLAGPVS